MLLADTRLMDVACDDAVIVVGVLLSMLPRLHVWFRVFVSWVKSCVFFFVALVVEVVSGGVWWGGVTAVEIDLCYAQQRQATPGRSRSRTQQSA